MIAKRMMGLGLLVAALLLCAAPQAGAQGKNSAAVVKAAAKTTKSEGKADVVITLTIDPKYHVYANPVGNADYESTQTTVKFLVGGKAVDAKVEYPAGETVKDKVVGDYNVYKGTVTIKARVVSTAGLEAAIQLQACSKSSCLLPATLKVKIE